MNTPIEIILTIAEAKAMHDWARIQTGTPAWYEEDAD